MQRIVLLSTLFLLILNLSFNSAFSYTFTLYEPPEMSQNGRVAYPKITKLESIILNKTFEDDDIEHRLQRLEKKTFSRIYSGSDLAWRVDNISRKIDQSELYNIPSKDLANLEKKILGKSYKKDNIENRLARLEQKMLGAMQSGKPDERYQTIQTASNHYIDFNNAIESSLNSFNANSTQPTGGIKNAFKNVFHTITNAGSITGFTPQISPYGYSTPYGFDHRYGTFGPRNPFFSHNPINNNYGPHFYHNHRKPIINRVSSPYQRYSPYNRPTTSANQFYDYNTNYSSGLGVHILD